MKKLIVILSLVLFSHTGWALTLKDLKFEIRERIDDTASPNIKVTDSKLTFLINQAQRDIVNNTWCLSKSTAIPLVSGTTYYTLPTDLIAIQRVTRERRNLPETALIKLDSDAGNSAWENTGGLPTAYFQDPSRTSEIGFNPFPNSSSSTGTIRIIYFNQATDLSLNTDEPFNAEDRFSSYHDLIIYYVISRLLTFSEAAEQAGLYRQEYENRLALMGARVGSKLNYTPSFSAGERR